MSKFFSRLVGSYKPEDRLIVLDLETLDSKRVPNCASIVVEIKRKDRHIRSGELPCTKETKFPATMTGQIAMTSIFFLDGAKVQAKDLELSIVALTPNEPDLTLGETKFDISKYVTERRKKLTLPIRDGYFNLTMGVSVVKLEEGNELDVNVSQVIEQENQKRQSKMDPNLVAALKQQEEQRQQQAELTAQRAADNKQKEERKSEIAEQKATSDLEEKKTGSNAIEATLLSEVQKLKDQQWEQKQAAESAQKTTEIQNEKIHNMDRALKELTGENAEQTEKISALEQELMEALEKVDNVQTVTNTVEAAGDVALLASNVAMKKELEDIKKAHGVESAEAVVAQAASNEQMRKELEEIKKAHGVETAEQAIAQAAKQEEQVKELAEAKDKAEQAEKANVALKAELGLVRDLLYDNEGIEEVKANEIAAKDAEIAEHVAKAAAQADAYAKINEELEAVKSANLESAGEAAQAQAVETEKFKAEAAQAHQAKEEAHATIKANDIKMIAMVAALAKAESDNGNAKQQVQEKDEAIKRMNEELETSKKEAIADKQFFEELEAKLAEAKASKDAEVESLMAQIVGHATRTADVESELLNVKAELEAANAKASEVESVWAAKVDEMDAKFQEEHQAHQETSVKLSECCSERIALKEEVAAAAAESASKIKEAEDEKECDAAIVEELKAKMEAAQAESDAKTAELEVQAEKVSQASEVEARLAEMEASAAEKAKELESITARLHYFEEEKKRNSSASAMFKQQQEKEAAERQFTDRIKIQSGVIDNLEDASEKNRNEIKALKLEIKSHTAKMTEAGIEF